MSNLVGLRKEGRALRLSKLFGNTVRQVPAEAEMTSHQLLLRAGMIRQLAAGIYSYLPLGWSVLRKIEHIMHDEMNAIGGQEMHMPAVQPAELWKQTGRHFEAGPVLVRFQERSQQDLVLGITHEGVITDLARREINSYRQLPFTVYQLQTRFRDEPRAKGGLVRTREFRMKDAYSFHADQGDLDAYYREVFQAYLTIFHRCGVDVLAVQADPDLRGGARSHEFMLVNQAGEDTLVICDRCGYAANAKSAVAQRREVEKERPLDLQLVATPGMTTIVEVAKYLGVTPEQTLKAIFYMAGDEPVLVVVRGDLEVNETKVANLVETADLRLALEDEVLSEGIVAGYASPIGLRGRLKVVADQSIAFGSNFVAGANKKGYHLRNVNYPRDFEVDVMGDIAAVQKGDRCAHCRHELRTARGIDLGHLFKLGTKYSEAMGATFLDARGKEMPLVMGCYRMGSGRMMAAVVEQCHDERGIIWPPSIAPYHVHLLALGSEPEVIETAECLYEELHGERREVLYDDRHESAGVKFNDADLIGIPLRMIVSGRSLDAGGVEVKRRREKRSGIVALDEVQGPIEELLTEIRQA